MAPEAFVDHEPALREFQETTVYYSSEEPFGLKEMNILRFPNILVRLALSVPSPSFFCKSIS